MIASTESNPGSPLIELQGVTKVYGTGHAAMRALAGIDLAITEGDFVAIMGHSGSGKTTLMHLVGGLDLPDSGRIVVDGNEINAMSDTQRTLFRRRRLGIVFQAFNLLPTLSALENVMLPHLVDGRSSADAKARAKEVLETVQLGHRLKHRPALMSGGEQQRVAIARALMVKPVLILADAPTGNLDPSSSRQIWGLLRSLCETSRTTVIMVTHEASAASHADRVLFLKSGKLSGDAQPEGGGDAQLVADRYAQLAY